MIKLRYLIIYLSLILGLVLMILPLPDWAQAYRPNWVALFLVYWNMALPKRVGLWFALIFGLLVDTLYGTLLGQHALALVLIVFINLNLYQRIRVLALTQQSLYVFSLLFIAQGIVAWVESMTGRTPELASIVGAPLVGMLIWPWIFVVLRDLRRKAMLG